MKKRMSSKRQLMVSILSLSLLTVMAGAAVAPALGIIQEFFSSSSQLQIQMIISIPAVFIVLTSFIFPKLCERFKARTLLIVGLLLYTVGGSIAGLFNSIEMVLIMRALVGIGVGIIMPLSTGLLSYYFDEKDQEKLMGYSSAMNQMGGVVATLLAGIFASISWRASFLVYLLGLISIILCLIYLPNDKIITEYSTEVTSNREKEERIFSSNYGYIVAIFLLMMTFFIYPSSFAIETTAENIIPQGFIATIMAGMDLIAFFGGLLFVTIKKDLKKKPN